MALAPPMAWNDWYTHYENITDQDVRAAADVMISSGLADAGYQYVNIDDCWMVKPGATDPAIGGEPRDANGAIRPNRGFPDMKALADYIHSKGLKAGLYTSPGPLTCAKFAGSYQHEEIDARTFAAWGIEVFRIISGANTMRAFAADAVTEIIARRPEVRRHLAGTPRSGLEYAPSRNTAAPLALASCDADLPVIGFVPCRRRASTRFALFARTRANPHHLNCTPHPRNPPCLATVRWPALSPAFPGRNCMNPL